MKIQSNLEFLSLVCSTGQYELIAPKKMVRLVLFGVRFTENSVNYLELMKLKYYFPILSIEFNFVKTVLHNDTIFYSKYHCKRLKLINMIVS